MRNNSRGRTDSDRKGEERYNDRRRDDYDRDRDHRRRDNYNRGRIMKEEGTADGTQNGRGTTTTDATTKEDIDTIGD